MNALKITFVSDLHGFYPEIIACDLLVVAGDCTYTNDLVEWGEFFHWFQNTPAKNRILVGGNHDDYIKNQFEPKNEYVNQASFVYLENNGCEIDGLKIWGSPCTPHFYGVRPQFSHFMYQEGKDPWDQIPENLDILITHGPPYGILDHSKRGHRCGCKKLLKRVREAKPKLHIFGHIHEGYGIRKMTDTTFYNVAINDENYIPHRFPTNIEI